MDTLFCISCVFVTSKKIYLSKEFPLKRFAFRFLPFDSLFFFHSAVKKLQLTKWKVCTANDQFDLTPTGNLQLTSLSAVSSSGFIEKVTPSIALSWFVTWTIVLLNLEYSFNDSDWIIDMTNFHYRASATHRKVSKRLETKSSRSNNLLVTSPAELKKIWLNARVFGKHTPFAQTRL